MKPEDIKINQLLEIEVDGEKDRLASRVEEVKDNYLFISMPMKKGALVPLWPGQDVRLIFRYKHSTVGGVSRVVSRRREPLPHLVVTLPQKLVAVNQKREFVRLPVSMPIRFKVVNRNVEVKSDEKVEIQEGLTIDISAGGLLFTTKTLLQAGQLLELEIKLAEKDFLYLKANVVRVFDRKHQNEDWKVALIYDDINDRQRDRIFKFIFDKQREWIKKGV